MPLIDKASYKRPFYLFNRHLETIVPSVLRTIDDFNYDYFETLELADGDFLKLGWKVNSGSLNRVLILSHGLEGDMQRPYILGTAKIFYANGWDVISWNNRSCGGEMNRLPRLYHHGVSDDLENVVNHVEKKGYEAIAMVGYSMGGSTTLKYLGEFPERVSKSVLCAAVFSVPVNLENSSYEMRKPSNSIYMKRFLKKLRQKVLQKYEQFDGNLDIDISIIEDITNFHEFDTAYTSPLHGFKDAFDFYKRTSSHQFLELIRVPSLIVNALNDPMLGELCYPSDIAEKSSIIHLETPDHGGHVGFTLRNSQHTWSETRALQFASQVYDQKGKSSAS